MASQELVPVTDTSIRRVRRDPSVRPTQETYDAFQQAFDYFNGCLFEDQLPNCVITLKKSHNSYGFFSRKRFHSLTDKVCDEIALNPTHFRNRPVAETLATLVHDMVHLWQSHHGKSGRGGYHNRQWADQMKHIGLYPSDTGVEGGKETGDRMSHYIMTKGPFEGAVMQLHQRGFTIPWAEVHDLEAQASATGGDTPPKPPPKSGKRVKYTCPECDLSALARHGAEISCTKHSVQMLPPQ